MADTLLPPLPLSSSSSTLFNSQPVHAVASDPPAGLDAPETDDAGLLASLEAALNASRPAHLDGTDVIQRSLAAYTITNGAPLSHALSPAELAPSDAFVTAPQVGHLRTQSAPSVQQDSSTTVSVVESCEAPSDKANVENQARETRPRHKSVMESWAEFNSGGPDSESEGRSRAHSRYPRRASFVPGRDLGSAAPVAAPPAERPISVSIRPASIIDSPAPSQGVDDDFLPSFVSPASIALARTNSISSQTSSIFRFPLASRSTSALPAAPIALTNPDPSFDRASVTTGHSLSRSPDSPNDSYAEASESDTHPLYTLLSSSLEPRLRAAWLAARMVLLPPADTLPAEMAYWGTDDMHLSTDPHVWQEWVASHAFRPSGRDGGREGQEHFVAAANDLPMEATIDTLASEVIVQNGSQMAGMQLRACSSPLASSPPMAPSITRLVSTPSSPTPTPSPLATAKPHFVLDSRHRLPIVSELIVYRQRAPKTSDSTSSSRATPTPRKDRSRLRAPSKWFRSASKSKLSLSLAAAAVDTPSVSPIDEPILDRIRLLDVGGEVIPWLHDMDEYAQSDHCVEDEDDGPHEPSGTDRLLVNDIAFFLHPPDHLSAHCSALHAALRQSVSLSRDFASSFLHVYGYEAFTLKRIRSRVIDIVWKSHLCDLSRLDASLFPSLIMGLCHEHLYARVILPQYQPKNRHLNAMITIYRSRKLTLEEFGLALPQSCDLEPAIEILRSINRDDGLISSVLDVDQLTDILEDVDVAASLLRAETPLDILTRLHRALEAIGAAVNGASASSSSSSGLTVDDYIPLLSYALVHADVKDTEGLSYYIKSFVQSDLSPTLVWSQTTFDAAVAFLRTNPFFADVPPDPQDAAALSESPLPAPSQLRSRRLSTVSMTSGPELSVHQTSLAPRRTPSTSSLPSAASSSRSHSPLASFDSQFAEHVGTQSTNLTVSPPVDSKSRLYSRRMQSRRYGPSEAFSGINDSAGRTLSLSDGSNSSRVSSRPTHDAMPPPTFPASAGVSHNRSGLNLREAFDEELTAKFDRGILRPSPTNDVVLQPPTPDVEVRPQIYFRVPGPSRPGPISPQATRESETGLSSSIRPGRAPLGRAHTHHTATSSNGSSVDMRRSQSDGQSKRSSMDSWSAMRSPASERSASPRSSSPSSMGHSLQRTLSISSDITDREGDLPWSWKRHRLSSASSASLLSHEESKPSGPHFDAEFARTRKNSVSAADALSRLHHSASSVESSQAGYFIPTRRHSTLSMSSVESNDTNGSNGTSAPPTSPPNPMLSASLQYRRRPNASRLRRDLLAGPSPLAPRHDNTSVMSLPASGSAFGYLSSHARMTSMPSPIKEAYIVSPAADSPVSRGRSPTYHDTPSSLILSSPSEDSH